jgi:hypothetical protein
MGSFDPAIALPGLMHDQASHPLREPMAILADVRFSLTPASLKTQRRKGILLGLDGPSILCVLASLREPKTILADVRFSLTPASLKTQRTFPGV